MEIVSFDETFKNAWDNYVDGHPNSTVYHTTAWKTLLQRTFHYKQKSLLLKEDNCIKGLLPLFEVKGIFGKRLVSSPFRDRGGALVDDGVNPIVLYEKAIALCRSGHYGHLLIKEGEPLDKDDIAKCNLTESKYWITTTVDLSVGKEQIWKKLKNNAQGPVKQASKLGIHVRFCSDSRDMEIFYHAFLQNRRNLGTPAFPRIFFTGMWENLCSSENAVLMLAFKDNIPLGGMILLIHKRTVIDGYAASMPEYRSYRPNDILIWKAMEWAADKGYRLFDFGADSPKQANLLAFKRKWTGVHQCMHHYIYLNKDRHFTEMDNSNERYTSIRRGIAQLPLPIFRIFSELLVARFG